MLLVAMLSKVIRLFDWILLIEVTLSSAGEVRLFGGDSNSGTVEVTRDGTRGFVCGQYWEVADAKVVCRMLGLSNGPSVAIYQATERFGTPSGVYTIQEMKCTGPESDIADCPASLGSSCGRAADVAGVHCFNTPASSLQVNLVGGGAPRMGRVQLTLGSVTSTASYGQNCRSVCKKLGYRPDNCFNGNHRTVESARPGYIPVGTGNITIDIKCSYPYSGEDLSECLEAGWQLNAFQWHTQDLVVHCTQDIQVSLEGGQSSNEGRVVFTDSGIKYTLSVYEYEDADAIVLCRMAGFSGGAVSSCTPGSGLSLRVSAHKCTGLETSLFDCLASTSSADLSISDQHGEDSGVVCEGTPPVQPTPQQSVVVLMGGTSDSHGAVRALLGVSAGYMCGSEFRERDAAVTCRTLNKPGYAVAFSQAQYYFGTPTDAPYTVQSLNCNGNEAKIDECPYVLGTACQSFNSLAGVYCVGQMNELDVQLVNGNKPNFGVVQVTGNGLTSTLQYSYSFEPRNSLAICTFLGYDGWSVHFLHRTLEAQHVGMVGSVSGGIPGLIRVSCDGSEASLVDCLPTAGGWGWDFKGSSRHDLDVVLLCVDEHRIELVGGSSSSEGRVELIANGLRLTMRDTGASWTEADARVLCRTAGYEDGTNVAPGHYGQGVGVTISADVRCSGLEINIADCVYVKQFSATSSHATDVGVKCTGSVVWSSDPSPRTTTTTTTSTAPMETPNSGPATTPRPTSIIPTSTTLKSPKYITTPIPEDSERFPILYIIIIAAASGGLLVITASIAICCCVCRKPRPPSPPPYSQYPSDNVQEPVMEREAKTEENMRMASTDSTGSFPCDFTVSNNPNLGPLESSGGNADIVLDRLDSVGGHDPLQGY